MLSRNAQIRDATILALGELCSSFYSSPKLSRENSNIVEKYLNGAENDLEEHIRMGYISALGVLPRFMLIPQLDAIIDSLVKHSLPPRGALQAIIEGERNAQQDFENAATYKWSEARRDSIKSLSNLTNIIGFDKGTNGLYASNNL